MMLRRAFRAALCIAGCVFATGDAAAQVRGRVIDAATNEPVGGSLVWLAGRTIHMTRTAADGTYEFATLTPGSYCIRVDTPGYEGARVCVSVSAGASLSVDLPLTMRPVVIEPIVVQGRRSADRRSAAESDSAQVTPLSQRLNILGAQSAHRAAAQLGDLARMGDSDHGGGRRPHALYMWGSSAERGRVLLDGASLSAPLHLGALLPPVDPQVVASADVHTGGISPRYDGGTAYIMNITTRRAADRQRTWGELDLLAGRIGAETPINGKGRMLVSGRRVNDEIIDGLMGSRFGYGYRDALARADLDIGAAGGVHLTAFATDEAVGIPRDLNDDRAAWENRAATLMWRNGSAENERSLTLSASRGVADLPLLSALGGHHAASLERFGALVERHWSHGAVHWDAGAEIEHHVFRRRSSATHDPVTGEPGRVACTPALPCSTARTTLGSAFASALFSPARSVSLSIGTRTMYDGATSNVHLLPRVSLTIVPDTRHSISLAAGRFSQPYVRPDPEHSGLAGDVPGTVSIASAAHVEIGVARRTERLQLRGHAYLRRHARVEPTGAPHTVPGADLSAEYALPIGTLALAYSVSGVPTGIDTLAQDRIQHLASVALHARHGRWLATMNAAYGAGLPITSIVLDRVIDAEIVIDLGAPPQPVSERAGAASSPDYLRIDTWVGAEWRIGRGERGLMLLPYVRIINALGQRESLFYFQDSPDLARPPRALARVPAVPVIGVRWHF
jgi:hypothetical protein